jgi:hypothetical protein
MTPALADDSIGGQGPVKSIPFSAGQCKFAGKEDAMIKYLPGELTGKIPSPVKREG